MIEMNTPRKEAIPDNKDEIKPIEEANYEDLPELDWENEEDDDDELPNFNRLLGCGG
ncbi:hypothetical protein R9C00_29140 [Flammeovirgaceae bacterium SG7u.111]|nr:hypothetical protein [Flammeovirgaceae bacterium SG7u.132]WPO35765.1 hypothetical protein R9C00_29140 [Flammeovirgaceae bacterium SG7u.111]